MSIRSAVAVAALAFALTPPGRVSLPLASPDGVVAVRLETTLGTIEVAVDTVRAPATAANFLRYVDAGFYNGGRFHRTLRPGTETDTANPVELIQASRAPGTTGFPAIPLEEAAAGLRHVDGALAMAQSGAGRATSDFFICIGDQPALDTGGARTRRGEHFPVFGRVTSGMDVVRRIQIAPVFPGSEVLEPPIAITTARRLQRPVR